MPTSVLHAVITVLLSWCLLAPAPLEAQSPAAQAPAGRIKAVNGQATIVRSGQALPATVGAAVLANDVLRTGPDGQLALTLKDESRLSLGPGSELTLSAFSYAPAENQLSLVLRVARGVLAYVSGQIAKLMPEAVRLETPTSVIGVRGTHALVRVEAP